MKKYLVQCIIYVMFILAFSCSLDGVSVGKTGSSQTASASPEQLCDITVSIILPDYDLIAESRAIAPQTYDIVLEYSNTKSGWKAAGSPVRLSAATKEPIDNMPSGFPGSKMTVSLGGLPLRSYEAGTLKISLRDSSQKVITSGTNTQTVRGEYGKSVSATFYTVPKNTNGMSGSLSAGEMKFGTASLTGGKDYYAKIKGTGSNYPDLVLFNENGAFYKYIPVSGDSSGETEVTIKTDSTHRFYLGIWAKNVAISSYEVKISDTNALFYEDFENPSNETENNWQAVDCITPPVYVTADDGLNYVHGGEKSLYLNGRKGNTSAKQFTVTLTKECIMSFWYRCKMYGDAYFTISIDNNSSTLPMTNYNNWRNKQMRLKAGTHTVCFKIDNTNGGQYTEGLNGAIIDDIIIQTVPSVSEFFDDFENGFNTLFWADCDAQIVNQNIAEKWINCGVHNGVLHDPHDGNAMWFDESSKATLQGINLTSAGALTFWYKIDSMVKDSFKVIIDNREYTVPNVYSSRRWQKHTIPLSAGSHAIQFANSVYSVYIDDVSVALDSVESVEITPRGKQQTYIGGHTISYTANALRKDGSVISGKTASWSVSGGGTISSRGVFTPSSAGTFTVTATIGNKKATTEVIVHRTNTSDPMTFGNYTFTGPKNETANGMELLEVDGFTFDRNVMPTGIYYHADGYIVIAGTQQSNKGDYNNRLYVTTDYYDIDYNTGKTIWIEEYFLRGDSNGYINERIWLRHGPGEYTITIEHAYDLLTTEESIEYNSAERGNPTIWGANTNGFEVKLHVTNDCTLPEEDAMWIMPSEVVGSDNYRLQNAVEDIIGALPENAPPEDKLKAIYDWEADWLYYDHVSTIDAPPYQCIYRRSQFAIDVFDAGCAVCEGYANLFAALTRYLGFKTKVEMSGGIMKHGWNQIWFDNQWLTVDVTWGDRGTVSEDKYRNQDKNPGNGSYDYFLLDWGRHSMYASHPDDLNSNGAFKDEFGITTRGDSETICY